MIDLKFAIAEGQAKAQNATQNLQEIKEVLAELNRQLKNEDISIEYSQSFFDSLSNTVAKVTDDNPPKVEHGFLYIHLLSKKNQRKAIGKWSQHPDGYPFTLEYLMERTDCWDKEALILRLTSIISSGQFWLKVNELKASNP